MNEILNELEESKPHKEALSDFWITILMAAVLIIFFGFYIGNLMFGVNSLEMLIKLDAKERFLREKIHEYQQINANLQKEYFELKELEADVK